MLAKVLLVCALLCSVTVSISEAGEFLCYNCTNFLSAAPDCADPFGATIDKVPTCKSKNGECFKHWEKQKDIVTITRGCGSDRPAEKDTGAGGLIIRWFYTCSGTKCNTASSVSTSRFLAVIVPVGLFAAGIKAWI